MFEIEVERRFGRFAGNQWVKDGNAGLALDDGHVRQVVVAHLVDTIRHFEKAGYVDQLRLPPQAGVGGRRGGLTFLDETVLVRVPDHVAARALDRLRRQRRDKTLVRQLE
ncbi:hypothetical protein D3C80_1898280 [compost metagenome]